MIKITGWKSRGLWSKIGLTEDTHSSLIKASNVVKLLKKDYSETPCEIRGVCIVAWVEPIFEVVEKSVRARANGRESA